MILTNKYKGLLYSVLLMLMALSGCGVKVNYSLTGASISPEVKTVSIQYFQNRASLVQPTLSQDLTDALIDKCKAQTNLKIVSSGGDVNFEGYITDYKTQPYTSSPNEQSASNRFTISVKVKFVNNIEPDLNFEQVFTRYEQYESTQEFNSIEAEVSGTIVKQLVEDIFNKAFVNW